MTALHLPASRHWPVSRGSCTRLSRFVLGLIAMAWAVGAHAFVTVGPSGLFPTIQGGINQAITNGGDEVRVQLQCFVGCSHSENVNFSSSASIVRPLEPRAHPRAPVARGSIVSCRIESSPFVRNPVASISQNGAL